MRRFLPFFLFLAVFACGHRDGLSPAERAIIRQSDSVMYVLVLQDATDSLILRTPSRDLPEAVLASEDFRTLGAKMLATVQSPEQGGVGIAAPQVGLNVRLIAVWRGDKPGEPFELYPNVHVDSLWGPLASGPEGCLSYPPYRGLVPRYPNAIVSYVDPVTLEARRDTVSGYTAIIFQHECDHLDGIMYIDRADTVFLNPAWEAERAAFDFSKPAWLEELLKQ